MTALTPLELQLDARPEAAATLRAQLTGWLEGAGLPRKDIFDVTLAATEAFENAVRHPRQPRMPTVDLRASITDSAVCVSVRDRGVWEDQEPARGNGLGLPMMRLLMDGVDVQTGADGTTVTMWRAVTPR